jgi:ribonuclease R
MYELSQKIRRRREKRGAIDFDFPEAKVVLDENGLPIDIVPEIATDATRIIEDFMLTANETVAEEFFRKKIPFVYRVHGDPDPEKIENILSFVRRQGLRADRMKSSVTPKEIQRLQKTIKGAPCEQMVSRLLLRSMSKARYSAECEGHFGLAAKYYCHFTSPIRRYPDLQIHRIIHEVLRERMTEARKQHYREILSDVALKSSAAERRAEETERETVKLKKAQYMIPHIGETFEGTITQITSWGVYVELPNMAEGLVHVSKLNEDYFHFNEESGTMVGRLSGKEIRVGDAMEVVVSGVDLERRLIDFTPAP